MLEICSILYFLQFSCVFIVLTCGKGRKSQTAPNKSAAAPKSPEPAPSKLTAEPAPEPVADKKSERKPVEAPSKKSEKKVESIKENKEEDKEKDKEKKGSDKPADAEGPRKINPNEKERKIADGAKVGVREYPTLENVKSDWDDKP